MLYAAMKQIVLIIDIQPAFNPPDWLVKKAQHLADHLPSIATIETHDETAVPFKRQLGWTPPPMINALSLSIRRSLNMDIDRHRASSNT